MKRLLEVCLMSLLISSAFAQNGKIEAESIKLTTGAGQGKVLVSDSGGDASWSNSASGTRSLVLTPGMANNLLGGASQSSIGGWPHPCILLPNNGLAPSFFMSLPLPLDYAGDPLEITVLYTSSSTTGNFLLGLATNGSEIGDILGNSAFGTDLIVPAASVVDQLAQVVQTSISPNINSDTKVINIWPRRFSNDALDTSTGILKIVGLIVKY